MTQTITHDTTRSLRRAAAAVAGLGIGMLVFALIFARPSLLENQLFLTLSLPVALLMIVAVLRHIGLQKGRKSAGNLRRLLKRRKLQPRISNCRTNCYSA